MAAISLHIDDTAGTGNYSAVTFEVATEIPDNVRNHMPVFAMTIPLLLTYPFPTFLNENTTLPEPKASITNHHVSETADGIFVAPVPPNEWCFNLDVILRNSWGIREDIQSIQHPTVQDLYLPLWALEFWSEMRRAVGQQTRWKQALTWVMGRPDSLERKKVIELFGRIPWGMGQGQSAILGTNPLIGNFADLLSFNWIRQTHLDVTARVFNRTASHEWWVGDSSFAPCLKSVLKESRNNMAENLVLQDLMNTITHRKATHLIFPVNLDNNHWIVAHVNLEKQTYSYGAFSPYWCMPQMLTDASVHSR
jgi:hypothetical protein